MGLIYFSSVGVLLLLAVGLSVEQWSGFHQGQDPLRLPQQPPVLVPQQKVPQQPPVLVPQQRLPQQPSVLVPQQRLPQQPSVLVPQQRLPQQPPVLVAQQRLPQQPPVLVPQQRLPQQPPDLVPQQRLPQQPPVLVPQQRLPQQPPVLLPQQRLPQQPPVLVPQQRLPQQPPVLVPQQRLPQQPPVLVPQQRLPQQPQQPPVLVPQQALQNPQGAGFFQPQKPGIAPGMLDPASTQSKQLMQVPMAPLTWRYPQMPEEPQQPAVPFQLQIPSPPVSVAAQCAENFVHVEVKKDFFGNGHLADPSSFSLGGCAAVGEDPNSHVLIFEYELHTCGSSLTMTADEFVYTFTLIYTPKALVGTPIVRAYAAAVAIQCHYPRLQNLSSDVVMPAVVPFAATIGSEEVLVFSLKLMTDDWMSERPVNQYFLGQFMNIEASVKQYNHVPLRIFIDGCVATAVPDFNSVPRYSFIENHGCLVDAKLTGSPSHFMHRVLHDKLQFQLEAFKFQQAGNGSVYITCALKALLASTPTNPESKACSFANGWTSADESDDVCTCCDSICGSARKGRAVSESGLVSEGKATIGPIVISD